MGPVLLHKIQESYEESSPLKRILKLSCGKNRPSGRSSVERRVQQLFRPFRQRHGLQLIVEVRPPGYPEAVCSCIQLHRHMVARRVHRRAHGAPQRSLRTENSVKTGPLKPRFPFRGQVHRPRHLRGETEQVVCSRFLQLEFDFTLPFSILRRNFTVNYTAARHGQTARLAAKIRPDRHRARPSLRCGNQKRAGIKFRFRQLLRMHRYMECHRLPRPKNSARRKNRKEITVPVPADPETAQAIPAPTPYA